MKLNKLNKKSGFTLLEIIIVIIIVGVLASLALPRFFQTVKFAKSTEALNTLGAIRRAVDRCAMMTGAALTYGNCKSYAQIGMENPSTESETFAYTFGSTSTTTSLIATSADGVITLKINYANLANIVVTRTGTSSYA